MITITEETLRSKDIGKYVSRVKNNSLVYDALKRKTTRTFAIKNDNKIIGITITYPLDNGTLAIAVSCDRFSLNKELYIKGLDKMREIIDEYGIPFNIKTERKGWERFLRRMFYRVN